MRTLYGDCRELVQTHARAMDGLLDKLPEGIRKELVDLKTSINEKLSKFPPLDQVPAANELGWMVERLAESVNHLTEYTGQMMDRLRTTAEKLSGQTTAYNELKGKVDAKEFIAKDAVKEMCDLAAKEAVEKIQPEIAAARKATLDHAGLPEAPEKILALPAKEFNEAVDQAKANLKAGEEKGLSLGTAEAPGKGAGLLKKMLWISAQEFAGEMKIIADVLPAKVEAPDPLKTGDDKNKPVKGGVF